MEEISADEAYGLGFSHGLHQEAAFKPMFTWGTPQYDKYEAGFWQAKRQFPAERIFTKIEPTDFSSLSYRPRALLKKPKDREFVGYPKKNSYKAVKVGE